MSRHDDHDRFRPDDDDLRRLFAEAGARPAVPEEALVRLREVSEQRWLARTRWRRRRYQIALALAATVAVLLSVVLLPTIFGGPERDQLASLAVISGAEALTTDGMGSLTAGSALFAGDLVDTPPGTRVRLDLVGGGSLRLDESSRLRLQAAATAEVESGCIYFDSGDRPPTAQRLELTTAYGTITDIGTRFELAVSEGLTVNVRQGEVRVDGAAGAEIAQAGESLSLSPEGRYERRTVDPWSERYSWISTVAPILEIEGRRLQELLAWAVHEGGWTLVLEDEVARRSAAETLLHGSIAGLTPQEALDLVLPGAGLSAEIDSGVLRVRSAGGA